MALKVRTLRGNTFRRCGMKFDGKWKTVPDRKLRKLFGSPVITPKSPTVEAVLMADPQLECLPTEETE